MRGFNGLTLLAKPMPDLDVRSDFLEAMTRFNAVPGTVEAREAAQNAAMQLVAQLYGGNYRTQGDDSKPYVQVGAAAVIPISGLLLNRFSGSWGYVTGYNAIRSQLNAAIGDDSVRHIIFDVNSPGGQAAGCFELAGDIRAAREIKPITAVVDGGSYSAAYALASQATRIIMSPSAGVGSIGVVSMHVDVSKALEEEGITVTFIYAGKHKVDGNPFEPLSKEVKADWKASVDKFYDAFVSSVADGRGERFTEEAARKTEAQIYLAADALDLGLVDEVATPQMALQAILGGASKPTGSQQKRNDSMSDTKDVKAEQEAQAKAIQEATQKAVAEALKAERARTAAIMTSDEAKGREALASHLAHNTDMTAEMAIATLKVSPKAGAEKTDPLGNAMKDIDHPDLKPDGGEKKGTSQERVSEMLSIFNRATGRDEKEAKH
jgi:signal peptide peptidase SppA